MSEKGYDPYGGYNCHLHGIRNPPFTRIPCGVLSWPGLLGRRVAPRTENPAAVSVLSDPESNTKETHQAETSDERISHEVGVQSGHVDTGAEEKDGHEQSDADDQRRGAYNDCLLRNSLAGARPESASPFPRRLPALHAIAPIPSSRQNSCGRESGSSGPSTTKHEDGHPSHDAYWNDEPRERGESAGGRVEGEQDGKTHDEEGDERDSTRPGLRPPDCAYLLWRDGDSLPLSHGWSPIPPPRQIASAFLNPPRSSPPCEPVRLARQVLGGLSDA